MEDTYNGWKNRETWTAAVWFMNDEGLYGAACEITQSDMAENDGAGLSADELGEVVGKSLEILFDDLMSDADEKGALGKGLRTIKDDIGSLYRVDWAAIGLSFVTDELDG